MGRRPVWAEVDVGAIAHNTRVLTEMVAPSRVCAVVKAYGYGHGPVRAAEAALAGGATRLGVALVEEGVQLRQAGITDPVLLLSQPPESAMGDVVAWGLTPALYTAGGVEAAAKASAGYGGGAPLAVHVKVDSGMHRVGAAPSVAVELAREVVRRPELALEGVFTHLAVADEPDNPFTNEQLRRYRWVIEQLARVGVRPEILHAANSAAAIAHQSARFDLVRCGIALYGLAPDPVLAPACRDLRPALSLRARVAYTKSVDAGERISYGLRYELRQAATVATVPVGYADGVPRCLGANGGSVLIGEKRYPIAGTVTMDQITIDCGTDDVAVGDEVVLIGSQGRETIDAWEWAARAGTVAYEITCGLSARVPRVYVSRP